MIKDHQGREFSLVREMCDHWGVNRYTYETRKRAGLSLEECLDPITHHCEGLSSAIPSEDHLGNKFSSIKEMCAHWKAPISSFRRLTRDGWSVKDTLEHLKGRAGTGRHDLNAHRPQPAVENGKLSTAQNARALRDWGFTKEEILPVYKKISLPVFKRMYLTNAEIANRMADAHICPRVTPAYAVNRFNSGLFTLQECALSPRAFLRVVLEKFQC